ncbi:alginate lyase family protein [Gaetbulibacter aquiaggeris]|uniref:Alginate lyase family protein n=1 Tax=Gaetbulibacter aquiaggeris TaxID=1735373 RepID=A0ABW7MMC8_9FLAO
MSYSKFNIYNKKTTVFLIVLLVIGHVFSQENKLSVENIFDKLNLESPDLREVNDSNKENRKKALIQLLKFYRQKGDVYKQVSQEDIQFLQNKYSDDIKRSIQIADEVRNKYFLFREEWDMERTNIPYQFKNDIDWGLNPFGDPEWTYMLNRHKYWIHLGKAYFFTGNEIYAKTFVQQLTHWIDNNSLPSLEDNYKESAAWRRIEAGIRCENWIKSYEFIKHSKYVTPDFLEKFLNALFLHGEYINNTFSNFSLTSNWGVLEYHGLFNLSVFLEDFKIASTWQRNAVDRLTRCVELQVLEDGTHWEHSPMYHNEVMHCLLNVNLLAQRKNIHLTKPIVQKTKDMVYANIEWQKPNYHQPLLGDSDDTDTRGLLSFASFIFEDSVMKSRAHQELDFENYLILGKNLAEIYRNKNSESPSFLSYYQENSGDFYMRTSWEEDASHASLHLRKLSAGHAHDDLLSFTIFANNRDYLVDNGRYSYVDNQWRKLFKSSQSHNTLGVDNLPNSILKDAWRSEYEAWSEGIYTKSHNLFDYGEAENNGYNRLEDPVIIKRRMLFLKPNVWLLFDSFSAKETHEYSQYFNFPNDKVQIIGQTIVTTYDSKNLKIQPIKEVEYKLNDVWYSPEYNLKLPSKQVEFIKTSKGFTSMITLLYFPEKGGLTYTKIPVYNREGELLEDKDVEAVHILLDNKEYIALVAYNSPSIANHFFAVDGTLVHGEVVLIEKSNGEIKVNIIK